MLSGIAEVTSIGFTFKNADIMAGKKNFTPCFGRWLFDHNNRVKGYKGRTNE